MAKTVLIPQTTFTGVESGIVFQYIINDLLIDEDTVTVVFDGVKYENVVRGKEDYYNVYGGFDEYPFRIHSYVDDRSSATVTNIAVQDGNEHTIEVYTEDTPSVTVQKPGVQVIQLDERLIIFDETTGDYKIFDGEKWWLSNDGFGSGVISQPSSYAVVGTAIVGKDKVGSGSEPN